MKRRMKLELVLAILMTVTIVSLGVFESLPKTQDGGISSYFKDIRSWSQSFRSGTQGTPSTLTQQIITENIEGQLRKGEFETTVEGLKNITVVYGGRIPNLHIAYDNELWTGTLKCKLPTDNVTWFTFEVRKLVNGHGKVTHVSIDVSEVEVNETAEPSLSDISIYLHEYVEGSSPFIDQLGAVVPLLTTGLLWIAEGLIVGLPLCFACFGVVFVVNRGILPVWKKQFKKSPTRVVTENVSR